MLLTERHRVDTRDVEFTKEHHHVAPHESHVEIARSRPVCVEWLVRPVLVTSYRASAQNHIDSSWRRPDDLTHKFLELRGVAPESEPRHPLPDLALRLGVSGLRASIRRIRRFVV